MSAKLAQAFANTHQPQIGGIAASVAQVHQAQIGRIAAIAASVTQAYQPQIATLLQTVAPARQPQIASIAASVAQVHQAQIATLLQTVAPARQLHLTELSGLARGLHAMPITEATLLQIGNLATEFVNSELEDVASRQDSQCREVQKLDKQEVAAMLTVTIFLFVYFSFALAIKYNSQIAQIAATDGPTPFDAAMAAGALTFWTWMNHSGRDS